MSTRTVDILFFLAFVSAFLSFSLQAANPGDGPGTLMLGCGSENEAKDTDGRKWLPDSKFVSGSNSVQAQAQYQDPALGSEVPYMKARIFTANATYKLPAKSKQRYFLRLHFYPSNYGSHNAEQAFFSVVANGVTLLKNFSASITCKATTQAYIIREYSLAPLTKDGLEVTFSVDTGFAFVNGIELVAAPDDLFDKAMFVGKAADEGVDCKSSNLQTVYRLNVGGNFIAPTNDSGSLGRAWYDDNAYIFGANLGVPSEADEKTKIEYKNIPDYSAPVDVYTTARTMGPDPNINMKSNLTWVFNQVDTKYMYIVRLHFSDFLYTKINQMVFTIYINNQTAESGADVIGWSGGIGKAIYKDYVTVINEKSNGDLWLALHPNGESKPQFYDSLLNGVEIFKMESSKSLAGPNPTPSDMLQKDEDEQKRSFETKKQGEKGSNKAHVIGGAAGGAAAAGVVAALCIAVYQRKKRVQGTESNSTSWLPIYGNSHTSGTKSSSGKSNGSRHLSSAAQGRCRRFSFVEMKQATKNFDEANVIGVGGFGKVYKGVIDNGATKVAIKRSNPQSEQGVHEFQTEIEMLSELRHKHLVSLIGFCEEDNEMCLVYDYMSRGTLREHIYKGNKTHLSWKQRLEICIGAAKGLHYLHTGARWTIIHRDVKTTNILLDENWEAKVSDFGLSKTGPDLNKGHVSTVVKGSFGYLDPEYFKRQQLTEKSDVYSFGVVLFEVLCARPALNPNLPKEQVSLADWALHCQKKGILEDIIDPHLKGKVNMESIKKFADTAEKCLSECGVDRPSLNDILWNLEFALQLQEGTDGVSTRSESQTRSDSDDASLSNKEMMAIHYSNLSLGSESDLGEVQPSSSSSNNNEAAPDSDSAIFSQIVNPTGR